MLMAVPCAAQVDTASRTRSAVSHGHHGDVWPGVAAAIVVIALDDRRLNAFAMSHHTHVLDEVARAADPFGRAGIIVPTLAASVVAPRIVGQRALSDAMLRVALSYAAADGVESVLKPLVGRHRPSDGGSQWRFHPLSNEEKWHSFPSAHTVHSFGLATGLAMEAHTPWVAVPAYGVATVVGLQRFYTGAHWGSDVIGSAALAVAVGGATDSMLRRRGLRWVLRPVRRTGVAAAGIGDEHEPNAGQVLRVEVTPWALGVGWTF